MVLDDSQLAGSHLHVRHSSTSKTGVSDCQLAADSF